LLKRLHARDSIVKPLANALKHGGPLWPALWFGLALALLAAVGGRQSSESVPVTTPAQPTATIGETDAGWAKLSASQQRALAPLKAHWSTIDSSSQQRWLRIAERYPAMSPQAQQRLHSRMAGWSRMTPDKRAQARLKYQQAAKRSPTQKQTRWESYQALRPDERPRRPEPSRSHVIAPAIVHAGPGATTVLMTQLAKPVDPEPASADPAERDLVEPMREADPEARTFDAAPAAGMSSEASPAPAPSADGP
jgi:Protein of unknown function (DUF3106)